MDELRQQMLAEQAERLARLELRNQILFVGMLIWGALLLGWLIYSAVRTIAQMSNRAAASGGQISFTCESCGSSFLLPAEYLVKHPFLPRKSVQAGVAGVSGTVRLSRRLYCPCCRKKTWCRQDLGQTAQVSRAALGGIMKKQMLRFFLAEGIIFAAGCLFFTLVRAVLS